MKYTSYVGAGMALLALGWSGGAAFAASLEPGETMGVSVESPLPEGFYAVDNENYGRSDNAGQPGVANLGVNIPLVIWSTPWTFYNTRVEILAAAPLAHLDGAVNQVGAISYAIGPIFAHDFGNGLTGGFSTFFRTPDPSANIAALSGRTQPQADIRGGLSYTVDGYTFTETSWYTGTFGNHTNFAYNDAMGIDFSATKKFGKLEVGPVGYAYTDIQRVVPRSSQVELGGMVGYDFGQFIVQGLVSRSVENEAGGVQVAQETRGWLRIIVPLGGATQAPPVVHAKY